MHSLTVSGLDLTNLSEALNDLGAVELEFPADDTVLTRKAAANVFVIVGHSLEPA